MFGFNETHTSVIKCDDTENEQPTYATLSSSVQDEDIIVDSNAVNMTTTDQCHLSRYTIEDLVTLVIDSMSTVFDSNDVASSFDHNQG